MNNLKKRTNKKTLIDIAHSSLDEEFSPIELNLNPSEDNNANYQEFNEEIKPENNDIGIRDKGDWECGISEVTPPKKVKCVSMFTKLPDGLTPHEIMYGKKDDDHDYINQSLG